MIWVLLFVVGGYAFGSVPIVKENMTLVILGIIVASILPPVFGIVRARLRSAGTAGRVDPTLPA